MEGFRKGELNIWLTEPCKSRANRREDVYEWVTGHSLVVIAPMYDRKRSVVDGGRIIDAERRNGLQFGGKEYLIYPNVMLNHGSEREEG